MSLKKSRQYRRAEALIGAILFYDWDPLGVSLATHDVSDYLVSEYDAHISAVYTYVANNDRSGLMKLLSDIAVKELNVMHHNSQRDTKVVELLLKLDIKK